MVQRHRESQTQGCKRSRDLGDGGMSALSKYAKVTEEDVCELGGAVARIELKIDDVQPVFAPGMPLDSSNDLCSASKHAMMPNVDANSDVPTVAEPTVSQTNAHTSECAPLMVEMGGQEVCQSKAMQSATNAGQQGFNLYRVTQAVPTCDWSTDEGGDCSSNDSQA